MIRFFTALAALQIFVAAGSPAAARQTSPGGKQADAAKKQAAARPDHKTPFNSADCSAATRFKGVRPADLPCDSPSFFDGGKLPNADRATPGWASLPTCLGIAPHINDYLTKNPNKCRRLDSAAWTPALNMRFIQCIGTSKLARGKHLWVTKATGIDKAYKPAGATKPAWPNLVTTAEMCYLRQLNPRLFPGK